MMEANKNLEIAQTLLSEWARETRAPEANRLDVKIDAADVPRAVKMLAGSEWGYLAAITGLDSPTSPPSPLLKGEGSIEILYHFISGAAVVTLRVSTPRAQPSVPSICEIIPAATVFERELMEMFGVVVVGTPDTRRLYLPDDWEPGAYPMRKDFKVAATEN